MGRAVTTGPARAGGATDPRRTEAPASGRDRPLAPQRRQRTTGEGVALQFGAVRQVVCQELGPLQEGVALESGDEPVPGAGQALVSVRAAGVNYVDGLICQGRYQMRPAVPFVPGGEMAGVVTALGPPSPDRRGAGTTAGGGSGPELTLSPGDRVVALTGFGAFASDLVLPAEALLRLPDALSFATGAAFVQSYCTAAYALERRAEVRPGEWVLVLGAGGGIGLAAADLARALGAKVVAAASSPAKRAAARAVGADAVVDYDAEDLKARVRELTDGGADVVVDPVGGPYSEPALRSLRRGGRQCVIGFTAGIAHLPLNQVLLNNRSVLGIDWGAWTMTHGAENRAMLRRLLAMAGEGSLHPAEPTRRPLEDATAVMAALLERSVAGKVVLVP